MRWDRLTSSWVMFAALVAFVSLSVQAQPPLEMETDGVYLLDVTSSMVGLEPGAGDILKEVIDILLADIDRFSRGKFILMTFANGPHDLDGTGPIQAIYEIDIRTEQDKLTLKKFLRPSTYGLFAPDAKWPGVYEVVKPAISIGPTGVYKSILQGLEILEELQNSDGKDYISTHTQELVVYTDGRNNAPDSPTFEEVLRRLKERHFQMLGQFRYKRYLFSKDPNDLKQAQEECLASQEQGAAEYVQNVIAPDITQLVILRLDRQILGFPNLWASSAPEDSRTVTLKNVQVHYDRSKEVLLQGGQIRIRPVKPEDFGLPPDVTIRVAAEPVELRFPLEQFNVQITLEPFSRLKAFMKDQQGLQGYLRFEFVQQGEASGPELEACRVGNARELLVDFKQSAVLADLPYVRPALQAAWSPAQDSFAITLDSNDVFKALSAEEQTVRVDYNEKQFTLTDDQGQSHNSSEPLSLRGIRKLLLHIRHELMPGSQAGSVKLTPELGNVLVNGSPFFSTGYEFSVIGFDRERVTCPNLWAVETTGDSRTVMCEFSIHGGPADRGQLKIQATGSELAKAGIALDVEPKTLDPPFDQRSVSIRVTLNPYNLLTGQAELLAKINRSRTDGYLLLQFLSTSDRLVHIKESRLPIDLAYSQPEIELTVNGRVPTDGTLDLGTLFKDQAALTLGFSANDTFRSLAENQQQMRLEYDTTHFYLTDSSGQKLPSNEVSPRLTKSVALRVNPSLLGDKEYEGKLSLSSVVRGLRIAGHDQSLSIAYQLFRPAAKVTINDGRVDRNLGKVRRGTPIAVLQLQYDETYAKEPHPIKVEYDERFFALFDGRGNPIQGGSSLSASETSLSIRVSNQLMAGALSRDSVATVRFSSEEGMKINNKASDDFSYTLHISGWLSTLLWVLGWVALGVLVVGGGIYCILKREWPNAAFQDLVEDYGSRKVGSILAVLVVLWLGGWLAGIILA